MTHAIRVGLVLALFTSGLSLGQSPTPTPPPPPSVVAATKAVELRDVKGKVVGNVVLVETPHGLLVRGSLSGLPQGIHAIHFHETGKCEPPFKSSGGHFNPTHRAHGMLDPAGLHAGDLPNLDIPKNGKLDFEFFAPGLTLTEGPSAVLDADGTALVIHANADDYKSQPAGNAGDRIACGVIAR
ncbi:MAG: superoxide dismutase family protein [Myxococcaceae bacterium]